MSATPIDRIGGALAGILLTLERRGATRGGRPDGWYWQPGAQVDCGHTTLVRQADRTLPDGRVVPGPFLAYRKTERAPDLPPLPTKLMHQLQGADRRPWPPGSLVAMTVDAQHDVVAQQVAQHVGRWGDDYAPVQRVSATTAPTEYGGEWPLPTSGTLVLHDLWMSLAAPQVAHVADALVRRRRLSVVLVMAPNLGSAAGMARDQWARVHDVVQQSARRHGNA